MYYIKIIRDKETYLSYIIRLIPSLELKKKIKQIEFFHSQQDLIRQPKLASKIIEWLYYYIISTREWANIEKFKIHMLIKYMNLDKIM